MTNRLERLREILEISDFTQRRIELRKRCQFILERKHIDTNDIKMAFGASPMVGSGVGKISPRPTISGFRDALDEATQIALITGDVTYDECLKAITNPSSHGIPATSSRSKTAYVFGRPASLTQAKADSIIAHIRANTSGDTSMSYKLGLQECIDLVDAYMDTHGVAFDDAIAEIHEYDNDFPRGAVESAMRLRGEVGARNPLTPAAEEILDALCHSVDEPAPAVTAYEKPDATKSQLIDLTLAQAGLPAIGELIDQLNQATQAVKDAEARASSAMTSVSVSAETVASGEIPSGKVRVAKAYDVFGLTRGKDAFNFDVPVWDWDGDHPHVPEVDGDYVFRAFELMRVLYALITNQRAYLHGHTGSGKTTLIEQVAARLCWPFMRVNFDSEITRMDLIGRDVLANDGGVTTSRFVDGILPQMMSGPYIGCFDELDFVRPDVAYVMQRAFEGNGLLLTEDGGRMVKPNKMFRAFATGNTVGQGDEYGMYQGARPQSLALLDRFTVWIHVDYMNAADRRKLIAARCPSLSETMRQRLDQYVGEHLEAFKNSKVLQPISPRAYLALGHAIATFTAYFPASKESHAIQQAIEATILDRATAQDRAVLKGIADRVFA